MASNRRTLLLTDSLAPEARALLDTRDEVTQVYFPHLIANDAFTDLIAAHAPVHGWVLGSTRIGAAEIIAAQELEVTARIGVGYDAIDVPAHTAARVPVMTAGTANSPSVAEHALTMMVMLAKRTGDLDALVRGHRWRDRMQVVPADLFEKSVLVIGFGRIGTRTAKRCLAFEMAVSVYDPYVDQGTIKAAGYEPVSDLDQAVATADFITIHCPKTPETIGMFDARRIGLMKPSAILVNTARGGLVDEAALYQALRAHRIAGAGLDVFAEEPVDQDNPLLKLETVVTSAHMAGNTREALRRMGIAAVRNVLSVLDGTPLRENAVNPEVFN
ncbi:MAG: hydroxyacid dehydrogenase [Hyphomicrobiaceae bacterium]